MRCVCCALTDASCLQVPDIGLADEGFVPQQELAYGDSAGADAGAGAAAEASAGAAGAGAGGSGSLSGSGKLAAPSDEVNVRSLAARRSLTHPALSRSVSPFWTSCVTS